MAGVRASARLLALAAVAAFVWLLAPALSAQPYLPGARDFEQALPAVERVAGAARALRASAGHEDHADEGHHADEGPVTHTTGVIEAPARFDAVGLAGELRPLELRARESDGEWSAWFEIANGDPAWFGGADELQLRTRGWRPEGMLHYVNVSGDSTPAEGLLTGLRGAVNGAVVSAAGLLRTDPAGGAVPKPAMVSRRAWGAELKSGGCQPREPSTAGRVKAAVVHHTVGSNTYERAEAPSVVLAICRYHRNALDWNDIGYNALVDRFGRIYVGRAGGLGRAVVGAHAQGVNGLTTGVAVMGTHTDRPITKTTMRGLVRWLSWKLPTHGKNANGRPRMVSAGGSTSRYRAGQRFRMQRIAGHRRTNLTECPGRALNPELSTLRRRTQARIVRKGGVAKPNGGGVGG